MKLNYKLAALAALSVLGFAGASAQTWYTTEASFMAALVGSNYTENFSSFTFGSPLNGTQTTWSAPGGNGFGWDAAAAGGLWSNASALSTNNANDAITITFTGAPVTAFGAILANTDINGNVIPGIVTMTLASGASQTVNSNGFLGVTTNAPITSITFLASDPSGGSTNNWVQIDHAITGSAVPEPATMLAIGTGLAALAARRRRK